MGILTLTGIIIGAVGTATMGVGGVLISIDCANKGTIKFLNKWKEETEKRIENSNK